MSAAATAIIPAPAPAPAATLLAPGAIVDGRYRIEAYLGGGGMAAVYRATHVVLEQSVAIKVVSPVIRDLPGMAERFLREAKAATHLKSEHVARVSDVGTMPDGAPYMVMEHLEGHDLDVLLDSGEAISVEDAVDYVMQACEALAEVHGLGIVHRDLKPANLFLTRGAEGLPCVKLIDFGISRTDTALTGKDLVDLTGPQAVMGTPRYMSPEQMEGITKADLRSDIYGIGAVLYELLTRQAPNEGDTFAAIYAAVTFGPPPAPSTMRAEIPGALDDAIMRCLHIDPSERFADVAALAAALAPFGPAGSVARAEAIARILGTARARLRDGSPADGLLSTGDTSHVRCRVSSSAYALRRRRVRRWALAIAAVFVGLAATGAAYSLQHPHNTPNTTSAERVSWPTLTIPSREEPSVPPPAPALPTPTIEMIAAPPPTTTVAPAPAPAPSKDERTLFEDRQ